MTSAAFYGHGETEDQAAMLADYPLDVCEVFLQTPSEYSAAFGALVKERLHGLPCVSAHPKGGTQYELDLFGRSRRQTEDAMALYERVCEAAEALGARYYVMHGPFSVSGRLRPGQIHELRERTLRLHAVAAAHGVEMLWENVGWCALRDPEDVREMTAILPEQRFVLDVKQAYRAGTTPYAMLEAMGDRVRHVHALDIDAGGRLCLPGEGVTDWWALMRQLRDTGYDGAVILEPYEWMARDPEALKRSLDILNHAMM